MTFEWSQTRWSSLERVPSSEIRVLGIDPSLSCTGIACVSGGRLQTTRLEPPKQVKGSRRLAWFYESLAKILDATGAEVVAIEGYAYAANARQHALGELGGVYRLCMHLRNQDFLIVPPTVLKKFSTGKGNADKSIVAKELFKRFAVDLESNDEVDAAGLALIALAKVDSRFQLPNTQQECLDKVFYAADE